MTRSIQSPPRRRSVSVVAALACATSAATVLPALSAGQASAATSSCARPTSLTSDDALRGPAGQLKDVRLNWGPVAGANSYQLQVSPDQDFSDNVFVDTTTVSTRYDVPPTVLKPSTYFWRVRVAGSQCWSDDGGTAAPQFAVAWKEAPAITAPTGTVSPTDLHFSWSAIPEAAAYELEVHDSTTDQLIGRCVTTHTSFAPYDEVVGDAERVPDQNGSCLGVQTLGYRRNYTWMVRGLDLTGTTLAGKPYSYISGGINPGETRSSSANEFVINHVYPVVNGAVDTTAGAIVQTGDQIAIDATFNGARVDAGTQINVGGQLAGGESIDPTTGYLLATVPANVSGGANDVSLKVEKVSSLPTAADQVLNINPADPVDIGSIESFASTVIGPWSTPATFNQSDPTSGPAAAPSGLTALQNDANGNIGSACQACVSTPVLHWNSDPAAVSYRVYVWDDQDQSSLDREYETTSTWLIPRDELLDNQAGHAYYWQVQACSYTSCGVDGGSLSPVASFTKDAKPVTGETPRGGATVSYDNVVLSWQHWQASQGTGLAAAYYHVQIATSCTFDSGILDDGFTDVPEFVNPNVVYPNGTYFWRVQAVDASGSPLAWDAPNHTTNNCADVPSFKLDKQLAGASTPNGAANGGTPSTSAPAVTIDATDKSVTKSGKWVTRKASHASKGTALVTDGTRKQSLTYSFQRSTVTVSYCTGPMDGQLSIYVDGKLRRNINSYRKFTSCGTTFLVGGLSKTSKHKLLVQASDKKGAPHGSTQVVVDFIKIA